MATLAEWKDLGGVPTLDPRLEKLSLSIREALQTLRDAIWSTHPAHDTIASLVGRIQHHPYDTLRTAGIACRFDIPEDLPEEPLPMSVRTGAYFAVKEAVHNVVRHAGATEVRLRVVWNDGTMRVVVEDNGRGFKPAAANGHGLRMDCVHGSRPRS